MPRALTILCLIVACHAAAGDLDPRDRAPWTGWPERELPTTPPTEVGMVLTPVWTLDCGEDSDVLVGRIVAATPAPDGRVVLVDQQLVQALVIDPRGNVERALGRRGEGPGEVAGAFRAVALDDGRIGICQGMEQPGLILPAKADLVFLDQAGDPAGVWQLAGEPASVPVCNVRSVRHAAGRVLAATYHLEARQTMDCTITRELSVLIQPDGARTVVASEHVESTLTTETDERENYEAFADGRADIHPDGTVAYAPLRDRWLVAVQSPDGNGVVYKRPWTQPPRNEAQREFARGEYGVAMILDHEPVLNRLRWSRDGCLWVESTAVTPAPGAIACFDEITPDGTLARRIHLEAPGATEGDQLLLLEDGRFVLLHAFSPTTESDTSPAVTLYEAR